MNDTFQHYPNILKDRKLAPAINVLNCDYETDIRNASDGRHDIIKADFIVTTENKIYKLSTNFDFHLGEFARSQKSPDFYQQTFTLEKLSDSCAQQYIPTFNQFNATKLHYEHFCDELKYMVKNPYIFANNVIDLFTTFYDFDANKSISIQSDVNLYHDTTGPIKHRAMQIDGQFVNPEGRRLEFWFEDLDKANIAYTKYPAEKIVAHELNSQQIIGLWKQLQKNYVACTSDSPLKNPALANILNNVMTCIYNASSKEQPCLRYIGRNCDLDCMHETLLSIQYPTAIPYPDSAAFNIQRSSLPYNPDVPYYDRISEPQAIKYHYDERNDAVIDVLETTLYNGSHDEESSDRVGTVTCDLKYDIVSYNFDNGIQLKCTIGQAKGIEPYIGYENVWKEHEKIATADRARINKILQSL